MKNILNSQYHGLDGYLDGARKSHSVHSGILSDTAPLLPAPNKISPDRPIFLRVCHSQWRFLGSKALFGARTAIATYLTVILGLSLWYEVEFAHTGKLWAFKAGNISFVVQVTYYWISSVWTIHHKMFPHQIRREGHGHRRLLSKLLWNILSKLLAGLGPPRLTSIHSKKRVVFSLFYTAAVTFPFLVTALYWLVLLHPNIRESPASSVNVEPLRYFVLVNVTAVNSIIALVEIMVLSSMRKQKPLAVHVEGIMIIVIVYLIWAVLGRVVAGVYVHPSLDPDYAGWRALASHDLALLSYTMTVFSFQRGLHGIREKIAKKAECGRQNHGMTSSADR